MSTHYYKVVYSKRAKIINTLISPFLLIDLLTCKGWKKMCVACGSKYNFSYSSALKHVCLEAFHSENPRVWPGGKIKLIKSVKRGGLWILTDEDWNREMEKNRNSEKFSHLRRGANVKRAGTVSKDTVAYIMTLKTIYSLKNRIIRYKEEITHFSKSNLKGINRKNSLIKACNKRINEINEQRKKDEEK